MTSFTQLNFKSYAKIEFLIEFHRPMKLGRLIVLQATILQYVKIGV